MATIRTSIQLYNGMTPALKNMNSALNMVLSSFEAVQRASSNVVDISSIQAARAELNKAEIAFNEIEKEIRESSNAQQRFNNDIRNGEAAANGLLSRFKNIAMSMGAAFSFKKIINASDQMVSTTARLDLMNDGLQTTEELQQMIFQSAQKSRSSYIDTANVVAKLGILAGEAFSSNQEMVAFAELMNKQFKIGGASIQEQTSAMYQLTQAMAAGRLQGDEFRSIMENAPMLAKSIAEYMGMTTGELREMSREGAITSDIIKNAMFAVADETNERFAKLPMTWGQVWTSIVNRVLMYSQPLLQFINILANNWSIIEPIILGIAAATLIYLTITKGAELATKAWTAAQAAFNAVMALNPIAIWAIAIVLFIALIYAVVAAVNKLTGKSISATGVIAAAFMVAIAFIGNLLVGFSNLVIDVVAAIWNVIASVAEFLANVFNDPIGSVVRLFASMADTILGILQGIAKAIDAIFGFNLASLVGGLRSSLGGAVRDIAGEAKIKIPRMDSSKLYLDRFSYANAYNKGYSFGNNLGDNLGSKWNDIKNAFDGISEIAENTGAMKDSLNISEEDLKYLRDLAEREVIDRTVLRDVTVTLTNTFGDIRETADVDGIISEFERRLAEAIESEGEGDHRV
ncbi:tape measure protein [Thermotalea metallivorans]|uniref:Tape measure protein N-terminal domain-containing protein n=1 Tax=Thermotalea metallivorans TaxID=520762 RepID=A0A140LCL6_9FIRM|nr:tape measure protein [Thermotalea metallivorans]KXG78291.1 hypothetical protein AN619_02660 [Thermotalea metallivorans]